jgi:hypothetical protein
MNPLRKQPRKPSTPNTIPHTVNTWAKLKFHSSSLLEAAELHHCNAAPAPAPTLLNDFAIRYIQRNEKSLQRIVQRSLQKVIFSNNTIFTKVILYLRKKRVGAGAAGVTLHCGYGLGSGPESGSDSGSAEMMQLLAVSLSGSLTIFTEVYTHPAR